MGMLPPLVLSQPGVFNVLDPWYFDTGTMAWVGMVANAPGMALRNAAVLNKIINIAQTTDCTTNSPYGAVILFPGHGSVPNQQSNGHDSGPSVGAEYFLQAPGDGTAAINVHCQWPLRFVGTGNARLTMVIVGTPGDMFSIQTGAGHDVDIAGTTFEDLLLSYPLITGTPPGVAAIHVAAAAPNTSQNNGGQNVRLVRMVFIDCPIGVWYEEALQCSMLECTIRYFVNQGIAVKLGNGTNSTDTAAAKQIYIAGCILGVSTLAPINSIGMQILGCDEVFVTDTRIDNFSQGILIEPGGYGHNAVHLWFNNVVVYAGAVDAPDGAKVGTAVTMQPQGPAPGQASDKEIGEVTFVNCRFGPGEGSQITTSAGPGIIINQNGSTIDTVRFVSCRSCRWNGPGLLIAYNYAGAVPSGILQNLEILGGLYSGNNLHGIEGPGPQPYGIAIVGPARAIRIVGVSCIGQYQDIQIGTVIPSPHQQIGIYIDQGAQNILTDGCDLTGNAQNGAQVKGEAGSVTGKVFFRNCDISDQPTFAAAINIGPANYVSDIQVTDCAGYNDQGAQLAAAIPGPGATFHNYTYGYYGPVEFYTAPQNATINSISVDSHITYLTAGSFLLQPGEYAAISWSSSGMSNPSFVMIGK